MCYDVELKQICGTEASMWTQNTVTWVERYVTLSLSLDFFCRSCRSYYYTTQEPDPWWLFLGDLHQQQPP